MCIDGIFVKVQTGTEHISQASRDAAAKIAAISRVGVEILNKGCDYVEEKVGGFAGRVSYRIAEGCVKGTKKAGHVSYKLFKPAILGTIDQTKKTARFIRDNWDKLALYFMAWAVVIGLSAVVYSFSHGGLSGLNLLGGLKAVSLPLTIGIACGFGFGAILQILIMKGWKSNFTFWGALNTWIKTHLDFGTGQILIAVAVTVILALAHIFPYVVGAACGIVMGGRVLMLIANGLNLGSTDPLSPRELLKSLKLQLEMANKQLSFIEKELEESTFDHKNIYEKLKMLKTQIDLAQQQLPLFENQLEESALSSTNKAMLANFKAQVELFQQQLAIFQKQINDSKTNRN